jgi:hypothetical protein
MLLTVASTYGFPYQLTLELVGTEQIKYYIYMCVYTQGVPYGKVYRYNPKHNG